MHGMFRNLLFVASFFSCAGAVSTAAAQGKPSLDRPIWLRGTLGQAQVQMNLRNRTEMGDGVVGEYFAFGHSNNVLLAGEFENGELFLEESENGKDISGHWSGSTKGETITGEWLSPGGQVSKPFNLRIVPIAEPKGNSSVQR